MPSRLLLLSCLWALGSGLFFTSSAQVTLKKKEAAVRLEAIWSLMHSMQYEAAINMFFSRDTVIPEDEIPKDHREKFPEMRQVLGEKRNQLDATHAWVQQRREMLEQGKYCRASEALDSTFTMINAYRKTIQLAEELNVPLQKARSRCDHYSGKMKQYREALDKCNYEEVYALCAFKKEEEGYLYDSDLALMKQIMDKACPQYEQYKKARDEAVVNLGFVLKGISATNLTYESAYDHIAVVTGYLTNGNRLMQPLSGNHPRLRMEADSVRTLALDKLRALKQFVASRSLEKLGWLNGAWEGKTAAGKLRYEAWTKSDDGTIHGRILLPGYADTLMQRIGDAGAAVTYFFFDPEHGREAAFTLSWVSDSEAVFENTQYPFPQRIVFSRLSDTRLRRREEGGGRTEEAVMMRVK